MTTSQRPVFGQRPPSRASRQTEAGHQSAVGAVAATLSGRHVRFTEDVAVVEVGGFPYRVEFLLFPPNGERVPVKVMWQDSSGSAEQKVPWHLIHLQRAIATNTDITRAYLVLGGSGWSRQQMFIGGLLHSLMPGNDAITIESLDRFLARFTPEAV